MKKGELQTLLDGYPRLTIGVGGEGVLLGTLGVLELNLSMYPFPGWSAAEDRAAVASALLPVLNKLPELRWSLCVEMSELSADERWLLLDRSQITVPMAARQDGVFLLLNDTQDTECFINDEEHLLIQRFIPSSDDLAEPMIRQMCQLRDILDKKLSIAKDDTFGYLSGTPDKCGEGISLAYLLHLPGLKLAGHIVEVTQALEDMNIYTSTVSPSYKDEVSDLILIHSPASPRNKLEETTASIRKVLADLTQQELNARTRIMQNAKSAARVKKEISSAFKALSHSSLLSYEDMLHHLSLLRLGLYYRLLRTESEHTAEALGCAYIDTAPATLRRRSGYTMQSEVRAARAAYARRLMAETLHITLSSKS